MEIVLAILFIIIFSLIAAFIEQNHKVKKLTGKSLWWFWTHSNKDDKE
jgi:hypothetical protein